MFIVYFFKNCGKGLIMFLFETRDWEGVYTNNLDDKDTTH